MLGPPHHAPPPAAAGNIAGQSPGGTAAAEFPQPAWRRRPDLAAAAAASRDDGGRRSQGRLQGLSLIWAPWAWASFGHLHLLLGVVLMLSCGTRAPRTAVSVWRWWPSSSLKLIDRLVVDDSASSIGCELGRRGCW
jgi:hypothetical protein